MTISKIYAITAGVEDGKSKVRDDEEGWFDHEMCLKVCGKAAHVEA